MQRPYTTKWLDEREEFLWNLSDKVCKQVKGAEALSQQCKEYVTMLKDDREWYRMFGVGLERRIEKLLEGETDLEISELRTKVREHEQIIRNTRMDYAGLVKNLEGPANVTAEEVRKLQERVSDLENRKHSRTKRLERSLKEQREMKIKLEKLQGNVAKSQKGLHKAEVKLLNKQMESLKKELEYKEKETVELKSQLEQTKKELQSTQSELTKEQVMAKSLQSALTKILDKFLCSDTSGPVTEVCYDEEIMKKIHFKFVHYVLPTNVLHYFHKYDLNILGTGDIEQVLSKTDNNGNMCGASVLLDRLHRYKNWFPCLLKVLRDPNVMMEHVADEMEAILASSIIPVSQPETPEQPSELDVPLPRSRAGFHEIVIAHEGEDLELVETRCRNQAHHYKYFPVEEFPYGCLYEECDHFLVEFMLGNAFDLVVRIETLETSQKLTPTSDPGTSRDDSVVKRIGSGMLWEVSKSFTRSDVPCSCPECKLSDLPKREWAEFGVLTAKRLMQNDLQCKQTVCRLFYKDASDRQIELVLTAVKMKDGQQKHDMGYCELCCITHDRRLAEELAQKVSKWRRLRSQAKGTLTSSDKERCVVVSYPHGLDNKCVSLGQVVRTDTDKSGNPKREIYNAATCDGCCGAPVFFYGKGFFTGQTVHNGKNDRGENESIEYTNNGRFE